MKAKFRAWRERIDALALRERVLVVAAVLGALSWGWNALLFTPLDARRQALTAQAPKLQEEIRTLHQQAAALALARTRDPDAANRVKLKGLRAEAVRVKAALAELTSRLVPPREMGRLIEAVLARQKRLSLVRLEGLGAEPIYQAQAQAQAQAQGGASPNEARRSAPASGSGNVAQKTVAGSDQAPAVVPTALYRHGMRATFEGAYLDILDYLRALEALPWRFLWGEVSLEVPRYPIARVTLTVYSLSLDDAWIGI